MRYPWLLIAGCLLVAVAAEGAARWALNRVSRIERRTADEYRLARTIGADDCGRSHLLFVGNSLLEEDVQFDRVREALAAQWDARRFVVEQTYYYDWYFGLRRLFREGARPDLVIVMLSARQWIHDGMRGDYSARYLVSTPDLSAAAGELGLNATQATNMVAAHLSQFWGARAEMRNFVLRRLLPELGGLMNFSSVIDPRPLTDVDVEPVATARIERLRALAGAYGARLAVLVPVLLDSRGGNGGLGLMRATRAARVATIMPAENGSFPRHLYRDAGLHLNPTGATAFTEVLIPALRSELAGARDKVSATPLDDDAAALSGSAAHRADARQAGRGPARRRVSVRAEVGRISRAGVPRPVRGLHPEPRPAAARSILS